ncbi:MAG: DUF4339 domain-containing protein, partial [Petrimonas mucosa]
MNRYFYIDSEGKQKGTFTPEELKSENIKKETLVWTQGMSEWTRAADIPELSLLFEESRDFYSPQPVTPPAVRPGYGSAPSPQQPMPKSWLIESILATILPFLLCSCIF